MQCNSMIGEVPAVLITSRLRNLILSRHPGGDNYGFAVFAITSIKFTSTISGEAGCKQAR